MGIRKFKQGEISKAWELFSNDKYTEALEKAEKYAKKNRDAAYLCGCCYYNALGCERNIEKAFKYFEFSKKKNPDAQAYYAGMLLVGEGCEQNLALGKEMLIKASFHSQLATMRIGELQVFGLYGFDKDTEKGIKNLRLAMEAGFPYAKYLVGRLKYQGEEGIEKDEKYGLSLIQEAASEGVSEAQEFIEELQHK